jgi:hypothetical protein
MDIPVVVVVGAVEIVESPEKTSRIREFQPLPDCILLSVGR